MSAFLNAHGAHPHLRLFGSQTRSSQRPQALLIAHCSLLRTENTFLRQREHACGLAAELLVVAVTM